MKYVSLLLLSLTCFICKGQALPIVDYIFPINPGQQNYLAGTMGEMRGSHFHGGIDVRTGGRIGIPILATADGYISRIAISPGGYGHALYLTHPDGNTSVYAHLNRFERTLEKYTRQKQYEDETYAISIFPEKNELVFRQGDVIAYSGNSGSSTGPHLHFEIRDTQHRCLNPLEFGFEEVIDRIPPLMKKIAFVTLDDQARINGAFGRYEFDLIKVNGKYTIQKPISLIGNVGIQIYHYDNLDGTYSRNGIPELLLSIDGDTVFHQIKERMGFGENREILVHLDYETYKRKRKYFNKLYVDDGNRHSMYVTRKKYRFEAKSTDLRIILRDNSNNISVMESTINNRRIAYPITPSIRSFDVQGSYMHFKSADSTGNVYLGNLHKKVKPYLSRNDVNYFLWDLKNGLVDSITFSNSGVIKPEFYTALPTNTKISFYNSDFDILSNKNSLFDTVYLRFKKDIASNNLELFQFKNTTDPIRQNLTFTLKPVYQYPEGYQVFSKIGNRLRYVGGKQLDDGTFEFKSRDFATYTIATDSIPPKITPISWSRSNLKVSIKDDLSGIKSYNATVDGDFLMMRYDAKKNLLMAVPHPNIPISGEFRLEVEDFFGNISELKKTL
ncbi:MAG: M23 family metallopeptidase [Cyclobacteriaceae bacterium]